MEQKQIDCPLCFGNTFMFVTSEDGFDIVKCIRCNFVFTNPLPSDDFFKKRYEEEWLQEIKHSEEQLYDYFKRQVIKRKRIYLTALRDVQKYIESPHILDIGSGPGSFLYWAKKYGFPGAGIEVSKEEATFAKKVLGLPVSTKPFGYHDFEGVHYNVITMFDVLEHIPQPNVFLKRVRDYQKKDNLLIVTVPNGPFIITTLIFFHSVHLLKEFKIGPSNHVNHFDKNTLTSLLKNSGYEIIKIGANHPDLFYMKKSILYKICKILYTYFFRNIDKVFHRNLTTSIYCIARRS